MHTPSELGIRTQVLEAYKQWVHTELAQCEDREAIRSFFIKNWHLTKGTFLMPTALLDTDLLRRLCDSACHFEVLFPEVSYISIEPQSFPDLNTIDLFTICRTHIISDNFKYLLPVRLICSSKEKHEIFNPYYNFECPGEPNLSESEWQRLYKHSPHTESYHAHAVELLKLKGETNNLLYKLELFCKQLKFNDAYHEGRPENAASGAYPAIIQFYKYYQCLDEGVISQIPVALRDALALLLTYTTDSIQNYNATEVVGTCIAVRRGDIQAAMKGHEKLLENLSINGEQKNPLIEEFQNEVTKLHELINSCRYEGYEQYGFTQGLLEELNIELQIQSFNDLKLVSYSGLEEFKYVCQHYPVFDFIADFDQFLEFSQHLSPEKLRVICSLNLPKFLNTTDSIHEWFIILNSEQRRNILEEFLKIETVWVYAPYIASLQIETFIDILNHSSMDEIIRICTQKDITSHNLLFMAITSCNELFFELVPIIYSLPLATKVEILCAKAPYEGSLENILIMTLNESPRLLFQVFQLTQELPIDMQIGLFQEFSAQDALVLIESLKFSPITFIACFKLIQKLPIENQQIFYNQFNDDMLLQHLFYIEIPEHFPFLFEQFKLLPVDVRIKFFRVKAAHKNYMHNLVVKYPQCLPDFINTILDFSEDIQIEILTQFGCHFFNEELLYTDVFTLSLLENYEFFMQITSYLENFSEEVRKALSQDASNNLRNNLIRVLRGSFHLLPKLWEIFSLLPLENKISIFELVNFEYHFFRKNLVMDCAEKRIEFLQTIFDSIYKLPELEQQKIYTLILKEVQRDDLENVAYMKVLCEILRRMPPMYKIDIFMKNYSITGGTGFNLLYLWAISCNDSTLSQLLPLMRDLPLDVKINLFNQEYASKKSKTALISYISLQKPYKLSLFFNEIKDFPIEETTKIFEQLAKECSSKYYHSIIIVIREYPEMIKPVLAGLNVMSSYRRDLVFTNSNEKIKNNILSWINSYPEMTNHIYGFIDLLDITTQRAVYKNTYQSLLQYKLNEEQQKNFCEILKKEYANYSLHAYLFPESLEGKDYHQMKEMIGFDGFHYLGYCIRLILEFIDTYITPLISQISSALSLSNLYRV